MNDASESVKAPSQKKSFDHILGQHYTVFDGLAGMHVEDIYQDRRGLLWVATVSRFDGVHFDTFGLSNGMPHLTVMTIAEDQGNSVRAHGRGWRSQASRRRSSRRALRTYREAKS